MIEALKPSRSPNREPPGRATKRLPGGMGLVRPLDILTLKDSTREAIQGDFGLGGTIEVEVGAIVHPGLDHKPRPIRQFWCRRC